MNRWLIKATFAVLLSGAGLAPALAAEGTADSLLACANETDDARRLRCFDAVVAGLRRAPPAPAATAAVRPSAPPPVAPQPAASPPVAPPTASPEEKFGARGDLNPERRHALSAIDGTVTEVGRRAHGELVVTLDNGQVWTERTANSKIKVKVGDAVKVEAGALGSYDLIAPNGRSSKVTRVR
jgi:biotin carboxyl carrier protein